MMSEMVDAAEATRLGIGNWIVPDQELESKTDAVVDQLLGLAPAALAGVKSLLRDAGSRTYEEQMAAELAAVRKCAATWDFAEALAAAREKRPPKFFGR
jgi:2-(1,2-epoxy-1,2-dihydrophenyl)acetyl-CoA isomerase